MRVVPPYCQAREIKSVSVSARGRFLRLVLHECYANRLNTFKQVGVIAVLLLGRQRQQPQSQSQQQQLHRAPSGLSLAHPSEMGITDDEIIDAIHDVRARKQHAIEVEDFEEVRPAVAEGCTRASLRVPACAFISIYIL